MPMTLSLSSSSLTSQTTWTNNRHPRKHKELDEQMNHRMGLIGMSEMLQDDSQTERIWLKSCLSVLPILVFCYVASQNCDDLEIQQ